MKIVAHVKRPWALALLGVAMACAIAPAAWGQVKKGGTLAVGYSSIRTLNPAVQSGAATAMPGSQLFAGLVQVDAKYQPQPYLAERWEISGDGRTYTFHLVKGATFHDGKPITSEDVAFSLEVTKKYHPFGAVMFGAVDKVETPTPDTAVIKLLAPSPGFMQSLQPFLMPILPKHIYGDGQDLKTHPRNVQNVVGSGPFKLVEYKSNEYLIMARNEHFFRKGRPYLDRIVFKLSRDPAAQMIGFERAELDYVPFAGFEFRQIDRIAKERKGDIVVTSKGYEATGLVYYLELNLRRKPYDDVRVRRAIQYAIDREFLANKLLVGQVTTAEGPLAATNPFYDASSLVRYPYSMDKAKALLDEAGLKPDADGVRFAMTLDQANWSPNVHGPMAEYIGAQLRRVGIKVTLRRSPDFATWVKRIASWDYDATTNGAWNYPDPVIGVHRLFVCDNIRNQIWTNTQGYCNKAADAALAKGANDLGIEQRKKDYAEFQHIVTNDLAQLFMVEGSYITLYHSYVKNSPLTVWGPVAPWDEVYLDKK